MTLRQPTQLLETLLEEKRSQFFTYLIPIEDEQEVKGHIERLRKLHPKASHVCSGFRLHRPGSQLIEGFSDDGEPSGTAGMPILKVLRHQNMANGLVAIARYFGGTKLGMGGLQRAYGGSAAQACNELEQQQGWQAIIEYQQLVVCLRFDQEHELHHWCSQQQARIIHSEYQADGVKLTLELTEEIKQKTCIQADHMNWQIIDEDEDEENKA